jgi:hypothetical protein
MIRLSLEAQQYDIHQDEEIRLLTDHTTISLLLNLLQKVKFNLFLQKLYNNVKARVSSPEVSV